MLDLRHEKEMLHYLETHKRYFIGLTTFFGQTFLSKIRFNPYEIRVKQTSENSEQLKIRKVCDDYFSMLLILASVESRAIKMKVLR